MAVAKGPNGIPLPRSLADARAIKRELTALYRQTKGGLIDPQVAGRLTHQLSVLVGIIRDSELEQRLEALERIHEDRLAVRIAALEKQSNGHDHDPARP